MTAGSLIVLTSLSKVSKFLKRTFIYLSFTLLWFDCVFYLGEVPALNEVSGHVAGGSAVNHRGDVVPGHSGSLVPVDEVCRQQVATPGGQEEHDGEGERK